ncbi:hypothetical protein VHEMI04443 [[Torrubiella] hemipterigena]|uniref:Uncharacterized protein n=1 Tax=[Torrubiella] hemipterigena TaxID=1531966 RepID=A0A0A1T197_9HYPO|nr:hypothetical protein VHEMI04443 [[Torrubiella] hemipterigena]
MKFTAFLAAALVPAASGFFLEIKDQDLALIKYVRITYRYLGGSAGWGPDAPYMGVTLDKSGSLTSTADLGKVYFRKEDGRQGWWQAAFSLLDAPRKDDITGPFAVEGEKLVYKGTQAPKAVWTFCPDTDPGNDVRYWDMYLTTEDGTPFKCKNNVAVSVPVL